MVLQSEYVANWSREQRLVFIGDGDSISVSVAYLLKRGIVSCGPAEIPVLDFDERIVTAIERSPITRGLRTLRAQLYNALDPIPDDLEPFDCFYSNPVWGASNGGSSVKVFARRGMELLGFDGSGLLVIADRQEGYPWTEEVLANVQEFSGWHTRSNDLSYLRPLTLEADAQQ